MKWIKKRERKGCLAKPLFSLMMLLLLVSATYAYFGGDYEYGEATGEEKVEEIFYGEEGQSKFITEAWGDFDQWGWFSIAIFAVFISVMIFGLVYAVGYAFNMRSLKKYALSEMLQNAATAIIVISLIGLLIGTFDILGEMFGGEITCQEEQFSDPIRTDMCRTSEMLNTANSMYKYTFKAAKSAEAAFSLRINMWGFPIYVGAMVPSIHQRAETLQYIAHTCVELMFFLTAKMYILKYIQENMLQVFLPLGIILRTFHFTRGIGAFFISLAIAFYFIYPTIVFIMDEGYTATSSIPKMPEIIVSGMCNLPMFGSFSFGSAALQQTNIAGETQGLSFSKSLSSFLADLYVHLLYSNMVAFAIAITFVRFSTTVLGGDVTPFMGMVRRLV